MPSLVKSALQPVSKKENNVFLVVPTMLAPRKMAEVETGVLPQSTIKMNILSGGMYCVKVL